jgi:hypothetical protein
MRVLGGAPGFCGAFSVKGTTVVTVTSVKKESDQALAAGLQRAAVGAKRLGITHVHAERKQKIQLILLYKYLSIILLRC